MSRDRFRRVGKPLAIFCPLADIYRGEVLGRVRRWFAQWEKELCRNQGGDVMFLQSKQQCRFRRVETRR